MFFFFPVGTDAPVYYWPFATIGLIVASVIGFALQFVLPYESWVVYANAFGNGLHPLQWLTSLFLQRDGIGGFVGAMFFLWAIGLIVEGKIGPMPFLGLFLGIGVFERALQQVLFLRAEPGFSVGSTPSSYGIMAIAMIWAPMNHVNFFYFYFFFLRFGQGIKDVLVWVVASIYLILQLFGLILAAALGLGTGLVAILLGPLVGTAIGLAIGIVSVKKNLVDCEQWDVFARLKQRRELAKAWKLRGEMIDRNKQPIKKLKRDGGAGLSSAQRADDARTRIGRMIEQGMATPALTAYRKAANAIPGWRLEEPDHLKLIKLLHEQAEWSDSVPLMRDYLTLYPEKSTRLRIRMAQVLVRELQRPTAALRVLDELPEAGLPADLDKIRRKLREQADALIEEGVLELEGDH